MSEGRSFFDRLFAWDRKRTGRDQPLKADTSGPGHEWMQEAHYLGCDDNWRKDIESYGVPLNFHSQPMGPAQRSIKIGEDNMGTWPISVFTKVPDDEDPEE